jgi:hypothetical protein
MRGPTVSIMLRFQHRAISNIECGLVDWSKSLSGNLKIKLQSFRRLRRGATTRFFAVPSPNQACARRIINDSMDSRSFRSDTSGRGVSVPHSGSCDPVAYCRRSSFANCVCAFGGLAPPLPAPVSQNNGTVPHPCVKLPAFGVDALIGVSYGPPTDALTVRSKRSPRFWLQNTDRGSNHAALSLPCLARLRRRHKAARD